MRAGGSQAEGGWRRGGYAIWIKFLDTIPLTFSDSNGLTFSDNGAIRLVDRTLGTNSLS